MPEKTIESKAVELAPEAFNVFCDDISGMFNVDMECSQQDVCVETVKGLKKRFRKMTAVNTVRSEGALDGTFQLIFDQAGASILSGTIVMLPEKRIFEEIRRSTIQDVESVTDAVKEVGNLLIGSWDKVYRKEFEGHGHFVQTGTYIGTPWDNPQETVGLTEDEEFSFILFKMTVSPYTSFYCGVIFPKQIFEPHLEDNSKTIDESVSEEENAEPQDKDDEPLSEEENTEIQDKDSEPENKKAEDNKQVKEKTASKKPKKRKSSKIKKKKDPQTKTAKLSSAEEITTETSPCKENLISQTIADITQSSTTSSLHPEYVSLSISAKDIMDTEVVWVNPADTVEQALNKMNQHDTGYLLVGKNKTIEGIVSKSDITGAISPYIRPLFSKWRRHLDYASLHIKVKWIMSRPVRTVKTHTSAVVIMENMRQFGSRCLPVIDENNKVAGIITVFDIFRVLNNSMNISTFGKTAQAPPMI